MTVIWDSAMQKRFERLEQNVEAVGNKVDALDSKVSALDTRFDGLERKIDELDRRFASKADFEQIREDIQKLGEGYDAGLKGLSRQMADINRNWDDRHSVHDLAIRNHEKRLAKLESESPPA